MVRRRRKQTTFGAYAIMGFMVFIMVGSLLGVVLFAPSPGGELTYGGLTFESDQAGFYTTTRDDQTYRFNNLPYTTLSVIVDPQAIAVLQAASLMILTFDPELDQETLQYVDFVRFELAIVIPSLGGGVTQPSETYLLPVIDCVNATPQVPVIRLEIGDSEIRSEGFCVILSGNQTTLLLAKDALLYQYFDLLEDTRSQPTPERNPI